MCHWTQYLHTCGHPAAHPFRSRRCSTGPLPGSSDCPRLTSDAVTMPTRCMACAGELDHPTTKFSAAAQDGRALWKWKAEREVEWVVDERAVKGGWWGKWKGWVGGKKEKGKNRGYLKIGGKGKEEDENEETEGLLSPKTNF